MTSQRTPPDISTEPCLNNWYVDFTESYKESSVLQSTTRRKLSPASVRHLVEIVTDTRLRYIISIDELYQDLYQTLPISSSDLRFCWQSCGHGEGYFLDPVGVRFPTWSSLCIVLIILEQFIIIGRQWYFESSVDYNQVWNPQQMAGWM